MKTLKNIILILISIFLISSCASYYQEHANNNFDKYRYAKAIKQYNKSLNRKDNTDARAQLANSFRLINNTELAEAEYAKVVARPDSKPINKFYYGKMLMTNGKYEEAKYWFKEYLSNSPDDAFAKCLLVSCDNVNSLKIDTTLYSLDIQRFSEMHASFSAVKYHSGIVFAGENSHGKKNPWNGESYLDLFYSQKDNDGKWISPVVLKGKINGVYHEGPATFNKSQDVVYFTRSNYSSKRRLQRDADNISNLKIFEASMINGNWEKLQGMPFNSDDYSCGHPTLSEDGKTLYFISDMPGGYGGTDVYKTNKTADGKWSAPINLGEVVNTPGNEMFPYIHGNDTLYFASEAHHSLGGLDVFMTYHASEDWHEPVNLNYPLNSSKDDFGFYLNNEDHRSGFVSSNRENMHDAVYTFHINDPTLTLKGVVTVKGTGEIIKNARIQVEVPVDKTTADLFTDENGRYFTPLTIEKEYKLMASKQNFLSMSDHVSTKNQKISKEYIRDFELEALVIQKPIIIPNIYYDFDKWNIRPDAAIELDKMVTLLNDNPKIRIEMGSHTDCRGTHKYNDVLSMKRARSTVEYLISKGIEKKRLEYKGYGETKLLNDCGCEPDNVGPGKDCTSEQHQQNRRTEFKVIEVMK